MAQRSAGLATAGAPQAEGLVVLAVAPHSFLSGARPDPAFLTKIRPAAKHKALPPDAQVIVSHVVEPFSVPSGTPLAYRKAARGAQDQRAAGADGAASVDDGCDPAQDWPAHGRDGSAGRIGGWSSSSAKAVTIYDGPLYMTDDVSIGSVDPTEIRVEARADDIASNVAVWSSRALADERITYFGVMYHGALTGQIFLHDADIEKRESLVGYHLFERWRGQGIGTKALRLLQDYVTEQTELGRLVVITGNDNVASLRMCHTCGFQEIGPSWEDPAHTMGLEWFVPRVDGVAGEVHTPA